MSLPSKVALDLWFFPVDATADQLARWRTYLDASEHARMSRFMFTRDQVRFTVCRSRTRRILGWYTASHPREITFASSGRGKPVLAGHNSQLVSFNLSHTEGLACLAVTHGFGSGCGHAVGVDLERIRSIKDDFMAYVLNPAELTTLLRLDPVDRQAAFFRYWTAKEAYLKSIGTGLWQSLKTFDVAVPDTIQQDTLQPATRQPDTIQPGAFKRGALPRIDDAGDRARNWHLYSFEATPSHIGAVAMAPPQGTSIIIRTRWLPGAKFSEVDGSSITQPPSTAPDQ
jgi:4'-phosphopantetheinyl transferase